VLLALQADGPDSELARFVADPTDENVDRALKLLRGHPAVELARDAARLQAAKAKRALSGLSPPPSLIPALEGLAYLADHAATRVA
jgi:heptaprenyl diphosphate synthase